MAEEVNESQPATVPDRRPAPFYTTRRRISTGLMIFVVVVGLPIVGVPSLRHRLSTRVMALKSSMTSGLKPVTLDVGANKAPFPTEYEHPVPIPRAPELPNLERVFTADGRPIAPTPVPSTPPRAVPRRAKIEPPVPPATPAAEPEKPEELAQTAPEGESELKYQQGTAEQEAYDLLLKSNTTVAALVQGSNPSLKFKSWDAANRGEDTYWVRLRFQSEGNPEADYIWQVRLQAKQITPLNYNARGIPQ